MNFRAIRATGFALAVLAATLAHPPRSYAVTMGVGPTSVGLTLGGDVGYDVTFIADDWQPGTNVTLAFVRVVLPSGVGFFGPRVDPVDVLAPFQSTTFDMFELSLPPGFVGGTGLILYVGIVGGFEIASCCSANFDIPVAVPLPATFPLFATGLGALGLLGWRRKRKQARLI